MEAFDEPVVVAQRQLEAFNARDVHAWLATYAEDARQYLLPGILLASGHAEIGARVAVRFAEPDLHARLLSRRAIGDLVFDHEIVTRTLPEGRGEVELMAVYEIRDGLIRTAMFAFGPPRSISA